MVRDFALLQRGAPAKVSDVVARTIPVGTLLNYLIQTQLIRWRLFDKLLMKLFGHFQCDVTGPDRYANGDLRKTGSHDVL